MCCKKALRERGAAIPLIIVFITVILIFAGLALDTTVLSVSKTEHRQLAENVALAALSSYLNTNPAATLDDRLALVKAKTQEVIRGNIKFAKPFMVSPSNTDNIDTRRGSTVDGVDGTLIPGNWFSNPPTDCTVFPNGTTCPCDSTTPWKGACFQQIDLDSATPPPAINAFRADLKLAGTSAVKTLFSRIFSSINESSLSNTATATTFPRHGVFAVDLSRSSHADRHQPYESTAGIDLGENNGMRLSAEYTFSIRGTVADAQNCAALGWSVAAIPVPVGGTCDIRGGVVPQLYRNIWYGAGSFSNFIPNNRAAATYTPNVRKHFKNDYTPLSLTYTDPGIQVAALNKTYLVDTWIDPNATPTSYEGPEPLNSMLAGVSRGLARVAANTVPGDQIGFIGFDYSARVTQRNTPLSDPGSVAYSQIQNVMDPTINPVPVCLEDGSKNVRQCRVENRHLITRADSGLHLPEAIRQARQLLTDAGNPFGAEEFVIVMTDGVSNCFRVGTNPGDNQRDCGSDEVHVTSSLTEVQNILVNTYVPNSIKLHFIHVGDAAGPHTILAPSPFRKKPDGTSAGCMTEDEAQKYSSDSVTPLDNFDNSGSDFANAMLNTNGVNPTTGADARNSFYFEPNRLRTFVSQTGGKWFPVRNPCQQGANLTSAVDALCDGQSFSTAGPSNPTKPVPLANQSLPGPIPLSDAQGRLICEPDDSDTYAPNPAPPLTDPIQPRSSKRTQIMRAVDQILSRSPYIIVQ